MYTLRLSHLFTDLLHSDISQGIVTNMATSIIQSNALLEMFICVDGCDWLPFDINTGSLRLAVSLLHVVEVSISWIRFASILFSCKVKVLVSGY